ncbi:MAG: rhodanese-like domain-containing protein [Gemmatimonadota bacterium]|nr:rhodanese-like domain-containing protein [Gemmatimonadota bacterium]
MRQRLERDRQGLQFWNALTDDYFSGEMILGSRRVPVDSVGREVAEAGIAKDTEIIVYCSGPTCPQSRAAAEKLTKLGFTNVRLYEGGLAEWKAAGLEIVSLPSAEPRAA